MFLTQIYGTVLGAFVNYAVMISIVTSNADLLVDGNGDASWSGATIQSYNTNAASWALAKYLYKTGTTYSIVPIGLAIGAGAVVVHRIVVHVSSTHLFSFHFLTELTLLSSSLKSAAFLSQSSISLNSSSSPDTSRTTLRRHALSSTKSQLASSCSTTFATTTRESSGITRI